jgi:hypothetical protein
MPRLFATLLPYDYQSDLLTQVKFALLVQKCWTLKDGTKQVVDDMFDLHPKAFLILKTQILENLKILIDITQIKEFRIFANHNGPIIEDNDYHKHDGFDIGGIYYVQTPGIGGELEFRSPNMIIRPEPGLLCLFDADYEHRVKKFKGYDRYGIGINIVLK